MTYFYIDMKTWDRLDALIIDEATLQAAEQGLNYLNPDDFYGLGEAANLEEAQAMWAKQWNESVMDAIYEANHP